MESTMGHYLVIGSGSIGRRHAGNLEALGREVRLLSWRALGPGDLEAELEGAAGAVIATATQVRLELVQLCAARDVPVYIEKPLAYRRDELAALFEAAGPIAERSVAGFMMRYHPAVQALHDDPIEAYRFDFEIGHDVRQWRQNWRFADSYAARREGGGVLLDLCHEIDMAVSLFPGIALGPVDSIGHADFPGVDFATRVSLAKDGCQGQVAMDYLSPKFVRKLRVRGREAGVDLDLLNARQMRWQGAKEITRAWEFDRNEMFLGIMADFIALAEGQEPSDNPLLPRLDRVRESCELIADAWEARRFYGAIEGGFA